MLSVRMTSVIFHLDNDLPVYGQTEILAAFSHSFKGFYKPCTIGRILSRGKFRIVDPETLQDVPLGEKGELLVKLRDRLVGYYNDPEASEACRNSRTMRELLFDFKIVLPDSLLWFFMNSALQ